MVAYLEENKRITDENITTLIELINGLTPQAAPVLDTSMFIQKSENEALKFQVNELIAELDQTKSAFNRANLYSASLALLLADVQNLKGRMLLTENVTNLHTANVTIHK